MKNIFLNKKVTLSSTLLALIIAIGTFVIFTTHCFGAGCDTNTIRGFIKPVLWFGIPASVISIFFLFFPQALFMTWLKKIASWYLPILFILTVTTPVNSGHVMSVDRSQVVFAGMIILALITLVFVGFKFYREPSDR